MKSLRRAWLPASAALIWLGCSVNNSGLSTDGAPRDDAGTGGVPGDGPVAGAGGGTTGGRGGAGGGVGGIGGSGVAGTSGSTGGSVAGAAGSVAGAAGNVAGRGGSSGGSVAGASGSSGGSVAGASGSSGGGVAGASGSSGGAIAGGGGRGGGAGAGGMAGTGGTAGVAGTGGIAGVGGVSGSGGRGGMGGRGGSGGRGGMGGRGGFGGRVCDDYPTNARAFVPPTDNVVHCYWSHANMQTWPQARQACVNEGGHLVTILSDPENLFVVSIAQFSPAFSDTWIGATDGKAGGDTTGPGTYTWVTGEPFNLDNWDDDGSPDGFCDPCSGSQSCTCDHRGVLQSNGAWTDRWEGNTRSYVCEATP